MRTATIRVGAAFLVAAASVAASQPAANAEPSVPNVKYTLTTDTGIDMEVTYLAVQPPNMEAFNADANTYLKRERVSTPWEFTTTLNDPQWAFLQTGAANHATQAPPRPHCEIAVDGQVAAQDTQDYASFCKLSKW